MPPDTHLPVTEETRNALEELKKPGETYDDLLRTLIQTSYRTSVSERFRALDAADRDELTPLDDS